MRHGALQDKDPWGGGHRRHAAEARIGCSTRLGQPMRVAHAAPEGWKLQFLGCMELAGAWAGARHRMWQAAQSYGPTRADTPPQGQASTYEAFHGIQLGELLSILLGKG